VSESELDNLGMKWVTATFHVRGDAKVVTCCGCGFPVNQNNPRCKVMDPDAYMGTYGPCCGSRTQDPPPLVAWVVLEWQRRWRLVRRAARPRSLSTRGARTGGTAATG
jgi:hypothetical protein